MEPAVGAYLRGMDTVPGRLDPLDFRIVVELDRIQAGANVEGDLFEIGAFYGKFAILLGYLARAPEERVTVCDVFEHADLIDAESWPVHNHWYRDLTQAAFVVDTCTSTSGSPRPSSGCPRRSTPRRRLGPAASSTSTVVTATRSCGTTRPPPSDCCKPAESAVFNDFSSAPHPGVALAVWELVLGGRSRPCA